MQEVVDHVVIVMVVCSETEVRDHHPHSCLHNDPGHRTQTNLKTDTQSSYIQSSDTQLGPGLVYN